MKAQFIDPTTGYQLGKMALAKNILPAFRDVMYVSTTIGRPVLRTNSYPALTAHESRVLFNRLVAYSDMTGWIVRIMTNARERNALVIPPHHKSMVFCNGETVKYPGNLSIGAMKAVSK